MDQPMSQTENPEHEESAETQEVSEQESKPEAKEAETREAEAHKEKAEKYWDQLLRLQAEFANYRKRTEREKTEAIRFGQEVMIERVIALVDVMEQALKHADSASDIESLKKGFEMVVSEFVRFLKSEGAEPLNTVGETFDPHLHEAVEQVETEDEKQNHQILEEVQKGYLVNGRLLRPAKVKVAKFSKEKNKGEKNNKNEEE